MDYRLPGFLVITIASGVAYTSYRLFLDFRDGLVQRLRSVPISRSSVLWAHVATSLAFNLMPLALAMADAFAMGLRPSASPAQWLAMLAGLSAKSVDGASAFSYPLIFLPFISSAFVPAESMPRPVARFAEHQAVTPIVEYLRTLLAGDPVGSQLWVALAWLIGTTLLAWVLASRIYHSKISS